MANDQSIENSRAYVKSIGAKAFDDSAPDARTDPEGSRKWLEDNGYVLKDNGFWWKLRDLQHKDVEQGKYYRATRSVYLEIEEGQVLKVTDTDSAVYLVPQAFELIDDNEIFTTYAKLNKGDTFVDKRGRLNLVRDKTEAYIVFSNSVKDSVDPDEREDDDDDDESTTNDKPFYGVAIAKHIDDDDGLLYRTAEAYMKMKAAGITKNKFKAKKKRGY